MGRLKELQERGGLAAAAAAAAAASSGSDIDSRELDTSHQYTSRNTGQPVAMDLCVVCGDRASGERHPNLVIVRHGGAQVESVRSLPVTVGLLF